MDGHALSRAAPATVDDLERVLGPGGLLSRTIPGYEHRPQQLAMARKVQAALEGRRYLLVEAGTGVGKTLAYLAPAVLSGRRVVVSTATKTLQEQIFFKDIPLLAKALGTPIRAAYMKGRSNYLCKTRHEEFAKAPSFASREEASRWPELDAWAQATETGDRAELALPETFQAWRDLSATAETCTGQRCARWEACFVTAMRRRAAEADLVVVNHHLFCADLALRSRFDGELGVEVIPRYDAVVFDEAHALEEVATDHFGVQVSSWRFEELGRDAAKAAAKAASLSALLAPLVTRVEGRAAVWLETVERGAGLARGKSEGSVRLAAGAFDASAAERVELQDALAALAEVAARAEDLPELDAIARRCRELSGDVGFVADLAHERPYVHFVERRGRGLFVRAAPVEVAAELSERLYGTLDTAVFTSATLAVGGSFAYLRRQLGLGDVRDAAPTGLDEQQVGSPFDFGRQAALYLPTHLPDPQGPTFVDEVADELEQLVDVTQGRAFALFTSVRNMQRAHALLEPRLPYRVLLQGQLPKQQLLERFREKPSVLFATASFWEGVDVPGEALSLVVIDKLPFASPTDPLVAARIECLQAAGEDPFGAFQVPRAVILLRQGFGRLIRTTVDRGIVAILDKRIVRRGYGRRFLEGLPPCPRFEERGALERWWRV